MPGGVIVNPEVYYVVRLLVPLPVEAVVDKTVYRLQAHPINWQLCDLVLLDPRGQPWGIERFTSREQLDRALVQGLELELSRTLAKDFFAALLRDGRAEVVIGRHCRVGFRTYQLQGIAERAN